MRVLICEDEMLISMMLEDMIADLGHQPIDVVATVEGALAVLRGWVPECAVVDLQLADGACYDVIAALKLLNVPFALLTGSEIDPADVRLAGIEVLEKPLDLSKLTDFFTRFSALKTVAAARAEVALPSTFDTVES